MNERVDLNLITTSNFGLEAARKFKNTKSYNWATFLSRECCAAIDKDSECLAEFFNVLAASIPHMKKDKIELSHPDVLKITRMLIDRSEMCQADGELKLFFNTYRAIVQQRVAFIIKDVTAACQTFASQMSQGLAGASKARSIFKTNFVRSLVGHIPETDVTEIGGSLTGPLHKIFLDHGATIGSSHKFRIAKDGAQEKDVPFNHLIVIEALLAVGQHVCFIDGISKKVVARQTVQDGDDNETEILNVESIRKPLQSLLLAAKVHNSTADAISYALQGNKKQEDRVKEILDLIKDKISQEVTICGGACDSAFRPLQTQMLEVIDAKPLKTFHLEVTEKVTQDGWDKFFEVCSSEAS